MNETTLPGQLNFFDPAAVSFARKPGGYLSLTLGDESYDRVRLYRALPYYTPERYISVCHPEEGTEYGMIRDLQDFPEDQRALIREELALLYYTPTVTAIRSAKMKMGLMELEVLTDAGTKTFRIPDPNKNIRYLTPGLDRRVLLTDCDGNRYLIPDTEALDKKSLSKIETYLV